MLEYATDYNKVIMVGSIASDITLSRNHDGVFIANFDILCKSSKNEFNYPVAVFGDLGEDVAKSLNKGERILIEGHLFRVGYGEISIRAVRVFPM